MNKILSITIFLLLTTNFYSQKILVFDSISSKPIPFANIEFSNNRGTITNEDGVFKGNSDEQIFISHISYETKKVSGLNLKDTIYLKPVSIELDEVVLSNFNVIDTLHKVRDKLDKNYIVEKFNQEGIYRYILKENQIGVEMIESEFLSYSKNLKRPYNARIERVKKTKPYEKFNFFGGLIDVINKSDISRNTSVLLEKPELFNLKYKGSLINDTDKYYRIDFQGEENNFIRSGYIILDSDNLAIVEINQEARVVEKNVLEKESESRLNEITFNIKYKYVNEKGYVLSYVYGKNDIDAYLSESIVNFEFENKLFFTNTYFDKQVVKVRDNYDENKAFNKLVDKFEKKRTWYNDELLPFTNEELQVLDDIYK